MQSRGAAGSSEATFRSGDGVATRQATEVRATKRRNSVKLRAHAADLKALSRDPMVLRRRRWGAGPGVNVAFRRKQNQVRPSAFGSHEERGRDVTLMQRRAAALLPRAPHRCPIPYLPSPKGHLPHMAPS